MEVQAPGVNFINVLRAAFAHTDPESAKNTVKLSIFFVLMGSAIVKTVNKTLVKLKPEAVDLLDALDWNMTFQEPRDLLDTGLRAKVSSQNVLKQKMNGETTL